MEHVESIRAAAPDGNPKAARQPSARAGIPLLLADWPAWRERVAAKPSVVRRLADELLRLVTPTRYVVRYATADVPLPGARADGARIGRGASVARIEIQTALLALLGTLRELRPHPSLPPAWDPNLGGYASYRCLCA